jgi:outer membrane receptor protein involved in Fe transport
VAYTKLSNSNVGNTANLTLNIGYNNPFLNTIQQPYQGTITTQRAATPNGSLAFQRTLEYPKQLINTDTDYIMAVGGLNGSFGIFKWDVGLQHAVSKVKVRNTANIDNGRLFAAVDAVTNSAGQIVCGASLTNAAYAGCVPLNLFGPTQPSDAALQYITEQQSGVDARSEFDTFNGSITGAPLNTWAGPVNMAVSGEWRQLGYRLNSDTTPGDLANCAGIRTGGGCTAGTTVKWSQNTLYPRSRVAQRVSELAYEADVPLLKDARFAQRFNLNGAARFTRYNTSGNVWTWKVGANWDINDDLRFRGTRSRDIRAPNLNDLFNPPQPNISNRTDIHTNTFTARQTNATTVANPDLVPEKADTITLGFVYRPSFAPRLSMSVDAYHIKVNGAIIVISATSAVVQQTCEDSNGTSSLCDLFVRPLPFSDRSAANFPTIMYGKPLNIASIETEGADFEVNYAVGKLNLRTIASYQPHLIYDAGPAGLADIAGTAGGTIGYGNATTSPRIKASLIARYDVTSNFNVTVLERWRNRLAASANTALVYVQPSLPSIAYTNLNLSYNLKSKLGDTELFLNIQNLFNRFPDGVGLNTGDDPYGRYYTAGFRLRVQ